MRLSCLILSGLVLFGCNTKSNSSIVKDSSVRTPNKHFTSPSEIKVSSPQVSTDSTFFFSQSTVILDFRHEESTIYWSRENAIPTVYTSPIEIKESTSLKSWVTIPAIGSSDTINLSLIKVNTKLADAEIIISPQPSSSYPGEGIRSLTDHKKGTFDFRNGTLWCGFDSPKVELNISFDIPKELKMVHISVLSDPPSWIFKPAQISVSGSASSEVIKNLINTTQNEVREMKIISIPLDNFYEKELNIVINQIDKIPTWHPGAGNQPWLFIDEIIVE